MYLENDKTFSEGQEGVVDPRINEAIDYSENDLDVELDTEDPNDEGSQNSIYEYGEEPEEEVEYEETEESEESFDEDEYNRVNQTPKAMKKQTAEENSAFAKLRRKEEELAKRETALREVEIERQVETEMLHPDKVWQYADEHGITEDIAKKILMLEARQVAQQIKMEHEVKKARSKEQIEELKKNPLYKHLESDLHSLLLKNPDVEAKVAFNYLVGENSDKVAKLLETKAEKRTLANVQDNMRRRTISKSEGSDSVNTKALLSDDGMDMTRAFGTNPQKIAQYVKNEIKNLRR